MSSSARILIKVGTSLISICLAWFLLLLDLFEIFDPLVFPDPGEPPRIDAALPDVNFSILATLFWTSFTDPSALFLILSSWAFLFKICKVSSDLK